VKEIHRQVPGTTGKVLVAFKHQSAFDSEKARLTTLLFSRTQTLLSIHGRANASVWESQFSQMHPMEESSDVRQSSDHEGEEFNYHAHEEGNVLL
jgi:hypothetical protein